MIRGLLSAIILAAGSSFAGGQEPPLSLADLHKGGVALARALPLLDVDDTDFERVFRELLKNNPKWNEEAVALLREGAGKPAELDERERDWTVLLQGFRDEKGVVRWVSNALGDPNADLALRQHLLRVMTRMQAPPSDEWLEQLAPLLKDGDLRRDVLAAVKKHGLRDFDRAILAITRQDDLPIELRIAAIDAIAVRLNPTPETFALLIRELQKNADPVARILAGRALASVRLSDAQAKDLATAIPSLSASMGILVLPAFARLRDSEVGFAIVKSLRGSPTAKRMTLADLDRLLTPYSNEVLLEARNLREDIARQVPEGEAESFANLLRELPLGDANRGRDVFFNSKAACANCHRAAGKGGGIGPNLSRVGFLRNANELLESIVLPNASTIPEFRSWKVTTDRGQSFSGFLIAETASTLYLREADRSVRRIPRKQIEEAELSRISLMPEGLEKLMSRQELADLVQFLAELR